MEEVQALQDLPAPAPQHLYLHHLEALQIPEEQRVENYHYVIFHKTLTE